MTPNLADLRREYSLNGLSEEDILPDPLHQFRRWFDEALAAEIPEPNAMMLSTVNADNRPASRVVLLKELDAQGFVFYTNYSSKKGTDLALNPWAALTFFWVELERQIRIEGYAERVSEQDSDDYFAVRPRGSQIGAWVSEQSAGLASRTVLEEKQNFYEEKFAGIQVPRPPHWGGYRVIPTTIEFWQGRPSRLHDRIQYVWDAASETWTSGRLSP
ncbi:pyridoxamine 5'-phosphate oxidase [Arundinibacter roseus]|uniref:Pyridoxine/pyridoxamine 5'-phosphate oxidase n=1 Tax=Arundinibacter roseus TaxID=2070510 RepID=A0A4V2XAA5_9BACT|nr:pyridoxamine 5'-phosphate oxidase [Arundinibacter roseus]TDB66945.1 pyridoxamine 5'-phosphate oxidase [Arundinibacter roseus]